MKKKTVSIAALLLTGTLLFAGCGKTADSTSNANASGQENTVTGQTSADTEAALDGADTDAASVSDSAKTDETSASDGTDTDTALFSDMSTTDLDGNKVDSSMFSDHKITLVNVWNIGCTPCVNEIPELEKINSEFSEKGGAVVGLYADFGAGIADDEMEQIKEILSNANASYTQLRMDGTLATNEALLNIMAFPTTYVVGSDGTILDTITGSNDYDGWKETLESYLAQAE